MRFRKWLGVRHGQVLMLAALIFMDVYLTETMRMFMSSQTTYQAKGGKFYRAVRAFGPTKATIVKQILFFCFAIGRTLSLVVVMRVNNKYLLISVVALEVVCYALFQYLVERFEYPAFVVLSVLVFLSQSLHYPLAINIIAKWIPPHEITRAVMLLGGGDVFARGVLTLTMLWSRQRLMVSIFSIAAILKTVWCIFYMIFGAQDPQTSFMIKKHEWDLLSKEIGPRKRVHCAMRIPWKSILTCPRLYAFIFAEIGYKWFYLGVTEFRTYAPEIDVQTSEIAMIAQPIVAFGVAWFLDTMIARYFISRNNARKIMNTVAMWGGALSLAFMCYVHKSPGKVKFWLTLSQYITFLGECSHTTSIFDVSPNYAAVIFVLYMVPAWVSVVFRSQVCSPVDDATLKKSLSVYYIAAFLMFVLNYAFIMLGNITLYTFDSYDTHDWRKESVISYP